MAVRYVEIGQYPDVRREVRGNLSEILVATANPGTYAAPEDVTGCFLEMGTDGKWTGAWFGDLGELGTTRFRDSLFTGYLARGVTCKVSGVPYSWSGAGVGWVRRDGKLKSRRVASLGTSIAWYGAFAMTNDTANSALRWLPNNSYSVGAFIYPRYADLTSGFRRVTYRCTKAGVSGSIEPAWGTEADSVTVDGGAEFTAVTTNVTGAYFTRGFWAYAQALAGQPLDEAFMVGYEGGTYPQVSSYWDRAIQAADPGVIFISDMWLNNISNTSFAVMQGYWADLAAKIDTQLAAGTHIILQTVLPKADIDGSADFTGYVYGDETRAWKWLNATMREFAKTRPNLHLFVVDDIYTDPNPANPVWPDNATAFTSFAGTGQQLKLTDGTHPLQNAMWRMAKRLAAILTKIAPPVDRFSVAGAYESISVNPGNYGTTGTNGTNTTGTTPDGLVSSGDTNTTVVSSVTAIQNTSRKRHTLAVTTTGAAQCSAYTKENAQTTPESVTQSSIVQAFAEVIVTKNPTNLRNVNLFLRDNVNTGSVVGAAWIQDPFTVDQYIGEMIEDTSLVIKTPPQKLGERTTLATTVQLRIGGTGSATFGVDRRCVVIN